MHCDVKADLPTHPYFDRICMEIGRSVQRYIRISQNTAKEFPESLEMAM